MHCGDAPRRPPWLNARRAIPGRSPARLETSPTRAIETDERAGTLKVLIDPVTEEILGASIVGARAGELVHVFVVMMRAKAPARALVDAECVHPTFAEGLQSLVMRLPRYALD